jgi:hypothetical protein
MLITVIVKFDAAFCVRACVHAWFSYVAQASDGMMPYRCVSDAHVRPDIPENAQTGETQDAERQEDE